jgi:SET domain-containing protein 6
MCVRRRCAALARQEGKGAGSLTPGALRAGRRAQAWDALNHVSGRANVRLHHDHDKGVLQMVATADIAKGG